MASTQDSRSSEPQITTAEALTNPGEQYAQVNDQRGGEYAIKKDTDVEVASIIDEAGKAYYSKKSVWLMILFSGLAIGSDG